MNGSQTRPLERALGRRFGLGQLWLISALTACHAAERSEPTLHTPAEAAAPSAAPASGSLTAAPPSGLPVAPDSGAAGTPPSASAAPEPAAPEVQTGAPGHKYVIAAVGDSLTDPRSHGGGYLEYLKTRCPSIEIDNYGRGATMVNQMRRHFDEEIAPSQRPYTHLVVFGGVNDLYSDLTAFRTPTKIEADLSYMYGVAKARGMKVVALTVAPWGGFTRYFNPTRAEATHALNAWIRAQPARGTVDSVVDAYQILSCGDPDVLCERFFAPFKDGIHFGPAGQRLLGEALYRAAFADCS